MPGIDGIQACRRIHILSDAYVIMLTARTEENDRLIGLSVGADDYLSKPFSPRDLVARIRAMLRRPRSATVGTEPPRQLGDLVVDPAAREAFCAGEPVDLTRTDFDLLEVLSAHPGVVVTMVKLMESVWGQDWFADAHVDVHVENLRRKLGDDAH